MRTEAELATLLRNSNTPHPKEHFEQFAVYVLGKLFPEKFKAMTKGECPDYSNDDVGLEITRAISDDVGNIDNLFREHKNQPYSSI